MLLLKLPLQRLKRLLYAAVAWQPLARPRSGHGPRDGVHDAATLQQNLGTVGLPLEGGGAKVNREMKGTVVKIIMSWKLGRYIRRHYKDSN